MLPPAARLSRSKRKRIRHFKRRAGEQSSRILTQRQLHENAGNGPKVIHFAKRPRDQKATRRALGRAYGSFDIERMYKEHQQHAITQIEKFSPAQSQWMRNPAFGRSIIVGGGIAGNGARRAPSAFIRKFVVDIQEKTEMRSL